MYIDTCVTVHAFLGLTQRAVTHIVSLPIGQQMAIAGCIQLAWRAYLLSPSRAFRMKAVVTLQAAVRGCIARRHVALLRQRAGAAAAMKAALATGIRSDVMEAALQLRNAGVSFLHLHNTDAGTVV